MPNTLPPNALLMAMLFAGLLLAAPLEGQEKAADASAESADAASENLPSDVPTGLRTPRATMQTFLTANHGKQFLKAAETLDFSGLEQPPTPDEQERYARQLKAVIDRVARVDYAGISDQPDGEPYRFPPGAAIQPIVIDRGPDGAWRFTPETVAGVPDLYESMKDRPLIVSSTPWYRRMTPLGNEAWRIAGLFVSILLALVVGRVARLLLDRTAARFETRNRMIAAVTLRALSRSIVFVAFVVGLEIGLSFLLLHSVVTAIADTIVGILFTFAVTYVVYCLVDVVDHWLADLAAKTDSKLDDMLRPMVRSSLRVTIIILAFVQMATILSDKPVTSIIAGLGVGGLAIGLAAQDTIKNFFGSMMIFSDRPFELGDRIIVDGHDGPVESVGFRSTQIRTLEGHLVTIPNGELANKSIRNVGKRPNIRRIMNVTVTYDTPPEKIRQGIDIIKEALHEHEGMNPDLPSRVFFDEFNDASLNIFVIYWYHPPDWWKYCEFSERLNFEILERFNAEGIEFAFPTQTLYLAGDPNRPLIKDEGGGMNEE